jgi:hypothetical protein
MANGRSKLDLMKSFLLSAFLCGQILAADSPIMLAGPWVPQNTHEIDFAALPSVPTEHVVISEVRDRR